MVTSGRCKGKLNWSPRWELATLRVIFGSSRPPSDLRVDGSLDFVYSGVFLVVSSYVTHKNFAACCFTALSSGDLNVQKHPVSYAHGHAAPGQECFLDPDPIFQRGAGPFQ